MNKEFGSDKISFPNSPEISANFLRGARPENSSNCVKIDPVLQKRKKGATIIFSKIFPGVEAEMFKL